MVGWLLAEGWTVRYDSYGAAPSDYRCRSKGRHDSQSFLVFRTLGASHGCRDGRYEGVSIRSYTPGDMASIMFYGRRFYLHGVDGPQGGSATLALDGQIHNITFLAHAKTMAAAYDSGPLREVLHSVVVVVGTKPKEIAPTGYVNIDYARIER